MPCYNMNCYCFNEHIKAFKCKCRLIAHELFMYNVPSDELHVNELTKDHEFINKCYEYIKFMQLICNDDKSLQLGFLKEYAQTLPEHYRRAIFYMLWHNCGCFF